MRISTDADLSVIRGDKESTMEKLQYVVFEIKIWNEKKKKFEYRDYAITVSDDAFGNQFALDAATKYAQTCVNRYVAGSTFEINRIQ